ncbi:MAG: serine hydrolase [Daejeonella sp.]|uniref:serine hydrolase domain-containing protein n=1 Tax=Daejeonella sp. TaxID=2805397 RepID=UPI003C7632D7
MKLIPTVFIAFTIFTLLLAACAPSAEHRHNEEYIAEEKSAAASTVLLNNSEKPIPLQDLQDKEIASVNMGSAHATAFDSILNKYAAVRSFSFSGDSSSADKNSLNAALEPFNTLILQITDQALKAHGALPFIKEIQKNRNIILSLSGDVQSLALLDEIKAPLIWSNQKSEERSIFAAQLIFGGVAAQAKLPKSISENYPTGAGFSTSVVRLKYSVPEDAGINISDLKGIDKIAAEAIRKEAAPSIAVMVIKDNKVIFNKAYGTHTYNSKIQSKTSDIYDVASLTKTSATTLAVMRLYEQGKLKLDTNAGAYLPKARKTSKNRILVRDLMLHQAGLVPFIPFYVKLTKNDRSSDSSAAYPTKVSENYFLRKGYFQDVMWPAMLNSALGKKDTYVYSDLNMYFMKEIVESLSGKALEDIVQTQFYEPLGMERTGFKPRERFQKDQIIPTEQDDKFRKSLLHGYVHDQGAAMVGGVAGHAGLFATTNDLGILYQMLLNGGTYGGKQYFKQETVEKFTARYSSISRRGLGFDRWDPKSKKGFPSKLASPETYGHTGYTGTCVWVDPKYNLVYIFLSNRVNPTVNNKLSKLDIRERIQDVVYKAILKGER